MEITGFNESWWLGLSTMHTLFAREHNLLCDELRAHYPRLERRAHLSYGAADRVGADRQDPYGRMDAGDPRRPRPSTSRLNTNWNGPPPNDWMTKLGIWLIDAHAATGIPQDQARPSRRALFADRGFRHRLPAAPADPRRLRFLRSSQTGRASATRRLPRYPGRQGRRRDAQLRLHNMLYSFGIAHPGAITLHNYPRSLQRLRARRRQRRDHRPLGGRHRPHPPARRAALQRLPHRPAQAARSSAGKSCATIPRRVRDHARALQATSTRSTRWSACSPSRRRQGFGFSDTAFRIFILMASRRLQSDRFLTVDFRPGNLLAVRHGLDRARTA